MSETTKVEPLTDEEMAKLEALHVASGLEWEGGGPFCSRRAGADREHFPCTTVRLIATWKAAKEQAAHWERMFAKEEAKAGDWMARAITDSALLADRARLEARVEDLEAELTLWRTGIDPTRLPSWRGSDDPAAARDAGET